MVAIEKKSERESASGSSLRRMLAVLDLFTVDKPRWTVDEIANALELTQSTAYRYVASLCTGGLLAAFGTAQYSLGPKIIELDLAIRRTDPAIGLAERLAPALLDLVKRGVVSLISIRGATAISVFQAKKPANLDLSFERGRSMSLFTGAAAKVILAHLTRAKQLKMYLDSPDVVARLGLGASWKEFSRTLLEIRREKALMTKGEVDPASWGIAAPIFNPGGDVTSSINLIMPLASYRAKDFDLLKEEVLGAAHQISVRLEQLAKRAK